MCLGWVHCASEVLFPELRSGFSVLMTLESEDGNENGSYKKDVLYYIAQCRQMCEA